MNLTIEVKGLNKVIQDMNDIGTKKIAQGIAAGLVKSSTFVKTRLRQNTPVDTGNLRDSVRIKMNVAGAEAMIGPNDDQAPYAKWVEYGHHTRNGKWVPGQHFIQRTALETQKGVQQIFNDAIKIVLK